MEAFIDAFSVILLILICVWGVGFQIYNWFRRK